MNSAAEARTASSIRTARRPPRSARRRSGSSARPSPSTATIAIGVCAPATSSKPRQSRRPRAAAGPRASAPRHRRRRRRRARRARRAAPRPRRRSRPRHRNGERTRPPRPAPPPGARRSESTSASPRHRVGAPGRLLGAVTRSRARTLSSPAGARRRAHDRTRRVARVLPQPRAAPRARRRALLPHGIPTARTTGSPFLERPGGIAPDLTGFGRSGKGGHLDYSLDGLTQFVGTLPRRVGSRR